MIVLHELTKRFEGRVVLESVSATFEPGAVTLITGPSGGGKSTLLRCINGLERFDSGRIRAFNIELGPLSRGAEERAAKIAMNGIRRKVAMVFQQYSLFAHRTALENVMEGPVHVAGVAKDEASRLAEELLAQVGLAHRKHAFPGEMSGGEQQRVAIARALAMKPEAILLDEPTAALDPERKVEVVQVLAELAKAGTTMIIVSHEPALVAHIARRTLVVRDGKIASDS